MSVSGQVYRFNTGAENTAGSVFLKDERAVFRTVLNVDSS